MYKNSDLFATGGIYSRMTRTKQPFDKIIVFRAGYRDVDLLRTAAEQNEMSQSEFVRLAMREKARRVLRKRNHIGELSGPQAA
jgi:uncharacterized protein (DUF1778 family)